MDNRRMAPFPVVMGTHVLGTPAKAYCLVG